MEEDLLSCLFFLRNHLFGFCKKHFVSQRHSLDEYGGSNLIKDRINEPVPSRNATYHNFKNMSDPHYKSHGVSFRGDLCAYACTGG